MRLTAERHAVQHARGPAPCAFWLHQCCRAHGRVRLGVRTVRMPVVRSKGTQHPHCIQLHGPQGHCRALQTSCYAITSAELECQMGLDSDTGYCFSGCL